MTEQEARVREQRHDVLTALEQQYDQIAELADETAGSRLVRMLACFVLGEIHWRRYEVQQAEGREDN